MATDERLERMERLRRRKQKLPNVVGLKEKDARLVLRHRGFYNRNLVGTPQEGDPYVDVRYVKSFAPYGTVVGQNPSKGQIVDTDERIELVVSMECLLDYLPGIYQRRQVGGTNYLREFLWIFQHIFYSIESKIDVLHTYFEVFETPGEFLPWLSSWVAFTLDGEWDETKRRLFLKRAVELYRIRGTVKGLETFIDMYIGVKPKIIENAWPLNGFQIGVYSTIGVESAILPPTNRAYCFIVEIPLDPNTITDDQIIKIHQIISQEKPAHTTYYLKFTGVPEAKKRWVGPVIGAYRVASTRDDSAQAGLPEGGQEPEAKAPAPQEVSESSLEERLAEKRRLLAERRKRRFGGEEGEAESPAATPKEEEKEEAKEISDDERLARRRRLRTVVEPEAEGETTAADILARRRRARGATSDEADQPTQVLDVSTLGARLKPTPEGPPEGEGAPPAGETTLSRLRRQRETAGDGETPSAETTLSRLRRLRETTSEGEKTTEGPKRTADKESPTARRRRGPAKPEEEK
ncbi:MAG: PASTA domain-containing protein [Bradymonadales bacterium]|nr:PASTA domain-containing protein [Bradymonadales bacterium]